jgi:hypothetical protein
MDFAAQSQVTYRDAGLKAEIAVVWNTIKNPVDYLEKMLSKFARVTRHLNAECQMVDTLERIGAENCFRLYRLGRAAGRINVEMTPKAIYREFNNEGSNKSLIFELLRSFDTSVVTGLIDSPQGSPAEAPSALVAQDPNFRPDDESWVKQVSIELTAARQARKGTIAAFDESKNLTALHRQPWCMSVAKSRRMRKV